MLRACVSFVHLLADTNQAVAGSFLLYYRFSLTPLCPMRHFATVLTACPSVPPQPLQPQSARPSSSASTLSQNTSATIAVPVSTTSRPASPVASQLPQNPQPPSFASIVASGGSLPLPSSRPQSAHSSPLSAPLTAASSASSSASSASASAAAPKSATSSPSASNSAHSSPTLASRRVAAAAKAASKQATETAAGTAVLPRSPAKAPAAAAAQPLSYLAAVAKKGAAESERESVAVAKNAVRSDSTQRSEIAALSTEDTTAALSTSSGLPVAESSEQKTATTAAKKAPVARSKNNGMTIAYYLGCFSFEAVSSFSCELIADLFRRISRIFIRPLNPDPCPVPAYLPFPCSFTHSLGRVLRLLVLQRTPQARRCRFVLSDAGRCAAIESAPSDVVHFDCAAAGVAVAANCQVARIAWVAGLARFRIRFVAIVTGVAAAVCIDLGRACVASVVAATVLFTAAGTAAWIRVFRWQCAKLLVVESATVVDRNHTACHAATVAARWLFHCCSRCRRDIRAVCPCDSGCRCCRWKRCCEQQCGRPRVVQCGTRTLCVSC
jgi:hypothetical protein